MTFFPTLREVKIATINVSALILHQVFSQKFVGEDPVANETLEQFAIQMLAYLTGGSELKLLSNSTDAELAATAESTYPTNTN